MDVLKLTLPQESVRGNLGVGPEGKMASHDTAATAATYTNLSPKATSTTPRKRTTSKNQEMAYTPPHPVTQTSRISWGPLSSITPPKPDSRTKASILKTYTPSPKKSPKRNRKRFISNPTEHEAKPTPLIQNGGAIVDGAQSPTKGAKRRRRRSSSFTLSSTNTSPKENKNQENIQTENRGENMSLAPGEQLGCPGDLIRTPAKRLRTLSGSSASSNLQAPTEPIDSPPKNKQSSFVPSTTVWGWSPDRGKFKPKSIEFQNGRLLQNPEVDGSELAASFKSKWQAVSCFVFP